MTDDLAIIVGQIWSAVPSPTFALIVVFVAVGLVCIMRFSVARIVWLWKHPSWTYDAAFNHVFYYGLGILPVTGTGVAAIWLLPQQVRIPMPQHEIHSWQLLATVAAIVTTNLFFYFVVVDKIRRPAG